MSFNMHRQIININNEASCPPDYSNDSTKSLRKFIEHRCRYSLKLGEIVDEGGISLKEDIEILNGSHYHGFVGGLIHAFAHHKSFLLKPSHIWILLLQAISSDMKNNLKFYKENQHLWTKHADKKTLIVQRDEFVLGKKNNWQSVISGCEDSFYQQIIDNLDDSLSDLFSKQYFSEEHDDLSQICASVSIMDICQEFFTYVVATKCGFRSIIMEGTVEDYVTLRNVCEKIVKERCSPFLIDFWLPSVLPILDEFCKYAQLGDTIDTDTKRFFWDSCCKKGGRKMSGGYTFFNGWINVFFPYTRENTINEYCCPFDFTNSTKTDTNKQQGMRFEYFTDGISKAPVVWKYHKNEIPLNFLSGFFGCKLIDDVVQPQLAWVVTKNTV